MTLRVNQLENEALQQQYNPRTGDWLNDTKDIILRFLQDLYLQHERGCYHLALRNDGTIDEKETEILISDQGSVNTDSVERRPAIIVSRGPFAYGNTSFDQLLKLEFGTGKRTHTDLLSGSFVCNCISSNGIEAEKIAVITARAIRIYRRQLQKAGFFLIGNLVQVGNETPPGSLLEGDSDEDFVNVPVTFPVYYEDSWTAQENAELLATIILKTQQILRRFDGELLVPDAINPDGSVNEDSEGVIVTTWTVP